MYQNLSKMAETENKPKCKKIEGFQDSEFAFPFQMYDMLEQAEKAGFQSIVSWNSDGNGFVIHDRERFIQHILPAYFQKQTRFRSFQRQLNWYQFERVKCSGGSFSKQDSYTQQHFLRGKRKLCHLITRKQYQAKCNNKTKFNNSQSERASSIKKRNLLKRQRQSNRQESSDLNSNSTQRNNRYFSPGGTNDFQTLSIQDILMENMIGPSMCQSSVVGETSQQLPFDDLVGGLFEIDDQGLEKITSSIHCNKQQSYTGANWSTNAPSTIMEDLRIENDDLFACDVEKATTSPITSKCSEALRLIKSLDDEEPVSLFDRGLSPTGDGRKHSWLKDHETLLREFASNWDMPCDDF